MSSTLFHLAFGVLDLAQTLKFYRDGLGCQVGRTTDQAIIMNLYGHQIVAHLTDEPIPPQQGIYPRHFGLIFTQESDWEELLNRAKNHQLKFYQSPKYRFTGLPTEHRTFFLIDPFENMLEFKYYRNYSAIFGENEYSVIGDRH